LAVRTGGVAQVQSIVVLAWSASRRGQWRAGRFAALLKEYRVFRVEGDHYAGNTFVADFQREGISYDVSTLPASKLCEALEPRLNAHEVVMLDIPTCEQQCLGLLWRGGKIDHPAGEHDDWAKRSCRPRVRPDERRRGTNGAEVNGSARQLVSPFDSGAA
jgi:hypothetical protein